LIKGLLKRRDPEYESSTFFIKNVKRSTDPEDLAKFIIENKIEYVIPTDVMDAKLLGRTVLVINLILLKPAFNSGF